MIKGGSRVIRGQNKKWADAVLDACPQLRAGPQYGTLHQNLPQSAHKSWLAQTLFYSFNNRAASKKHTSHIPVVRELVDTQDGLSRFTLSVFQSDLPRKGREEAWGEHTARGLRTVPNDGKPILLMHHGITGSSRTTGQHVQYFCDQGWRVVGMCRRGHDPHYKMENPKFNMLGDWIDVRQAVDYISDTFPGSDIFSLGVSVGCGPIAAYAARAGLDTPVKGIALISPTWDQDYRWDRHIPTVYRRQVDRFLVSRIKRVPRGQAEILKATDPETYSLMMRANSTATMLQQALKYSGFTEADDLLAHCNPFPKFPNIKIPFLILASLDDPISAPPSDDDWRIEPIPKGLMVMANYGGHCAFYESSDGISHPKTWADPSVGEFFDYLRTE